jgi:hypothetical protein
MRRRFRSRAATSVCIAASGATPSPRLRRAECRVFRGTATIAIASRSFHVVWRRARRRPRFAAFRVELMLGDARRYRAGAARRGVDGGACPPCVVVDSPGRLRNSHSCVADVGAKRLQGPNAPNAIRSLSLPCQLVCRLPLRFCPLCRSAEWQTPIGSLTSEGVLAPHPQIQFKYKGFRVVCESLRSPRLSSSQCAGLGVSVHKASDRFDSVNSNVRPLRRPSVLHPRWLRSCFYQLSSWKAQCDSLTNCLGGYQFLNSAAHASDYPSVSASFLSRTRPTYASPFSTPPIRSTVPPELATVRHQRGVGGR